MIRGISAGCCLLSCPGRYNIRYVGDESICLISFWRYVCEVISVILQTDNILPVHQCLLTCSQLLLQCETITIGHCRVQVAHGCNDLLHYNTTKRLELNIWADLILRRISRKQICQTKESNVSDCHSETTFKEQEANDYNKRHFLTNINFSASLKNVQASDFQSSTQFFFSIFFVTLTICAKNFPAVVWVTLSNDWVFVSTAAFYSSFSSDDLWSRPDLSWRSEPRF